MITIGETLTNTASGEQVTFVETAASTGGALLAFESLIPAGVAGPPLHMHPRQEERFTVLNGALHLTVEGEPRMLHSGETLVVPPGTRHTFDNRTQDAAVRFRAELRPALESEELFASNVYAANQRGAATASLLQTAQILDRFDIGLALVGLAPGVQRRLMAVLAALGRLRGYRIAHNGRWTIDG